MDIPTSPSEIEELIDWRAQTADWGVLHTLTRAGAPVGHIQAFVGSLYKVYRERTDRQPERIAIVKTNLEDAKIILEDATWDGPATPSTPPQHFCAPLLHGARAYNKLFLYALADPLTITKQAGRWELTSGDLPVLTAIHHCPFCGQALN